MVPPAESEDEQMLREREEALRKDRKKQAEWYESLNLYAEALRVYETIRDEQNIKRLRMKMREEYGKNALKMEESGRFQDAANLYYLIGDHASVGRMKEKKPDLMIFYDQESGGLARLASTLAPQDDFEERDDLFQKPNVDREEREKETDGRSPEENASDIRTTEKRYPVKIPKERKKARFCPYCGEEISTRKEPRFCPFCGEEL
ncbi:MAG TPA: zinc ribbon domain-containing protein [Euryarchaeota archaeon]|nr:MAG: hypothetical protein DRN57_02500 [Thermoplasmata archaeon]HHD16282.1 zinc ribbon domain-containing protein [Euryarchaeota archaeon]